MIILEKKKERKFKASDRWPLLYAIADIYKRYSSEKNLLSSEQVSSILTEEYGIDKIDRHAIQECRCRLEEYFGYKFGPDGPIKKKGYYLQKVDYVLSDDQLASIAIMVQSNKSFSESAKEKILDSLEAYTESPKVRTLITAVKQIRVAAGNDADEDDVSVTVRRLLLLVKDRRKIVIRYSNPWSERTSITSFYPQCIFVQSNEFFLLGMRYFDKPGYFYSTAKIIRIRSIEQFRIEPHSGVDPYQNDPARLTIYPYKKEPQILELADFISMFGDTKWGYVSPFSLQRIAVAKIKVRPLSSEDLGTIMENLQNKYGDCVEECGSETVTLANEKTKRVHTRKIVYISLRLPEEELFSTLFQYSRYMSLVGPDSLLQKYKSALLRRAKEINIE